jgi:phosphopantothenoylcysteine decarboxylase / phosphopantothenate---cysteine ligase
MKDKRILIGVTGGIAAYKVPLLVRLLVKAGADVTVIATPSAFDFVTRPTLAVLTGKPVHSEMLDSATGEWHNHVQLGTGADLFVIAPLTANTLGKMANGLCDNLVMATYLSATCPILVAPAMDLDMWKHPAVVANMDKVRSYGNHVVGPGTGELASGLSGEGRMAEPEEIFNVIQQLLRE